MIQYTANDIVEKALALADLQNSDFISYKEKIQYLNDAYCYMFNKLINYGDNNFTETVLIEGDSISIPSDFYQLREVYVLNNKVKTLLTPKPLNQSYNYLSYELVNNELYIYGEPNGEVYMSYYKVPQTLLCNNPSKELDTSLTVDDVSPVITAQALGSWKDWYLSYNGENGNLKNFKDGAINKTVSYIGINKTAAQNYPIFQFFNKKENVCIPNMKEVDGYFYLGKVVSGTNTTNGKIELAPSGTIFELAFYNNSFYTYKRDGNNALSKPVFNNGVISSYTNSITLDFDVPKLSVYLPQVIIFPYDIDEDNCIIFDANKYRIGVNGETKQFKDILQSGEVITHFWYNKDDRIVGDSLIFITSFNRIFQLNTSMEEPVFIKQLDTDLDFLAFNGFDADTGYGIVCYDSARELIVMASAFDDTVLSFPNNMYFTIISYMLAILFCNKQSKDNSALKLELENQENLFYDSLHRDETSFRIVNVDDYN